MKKRIINFILSVALVLSVVVMPAEALGPKNFTVKVDGVRAEAGENRVAVDIIVENNPGFAGFSFCVNYDSDKLVLVESEITIENGFSVVKQQGSSSVNLAWAGISEYSGTGKIATLYFNIPKDIAAGDAIVNIVYRDGYDSFYDFDENDITLQTVNGAVIIDSLKQTDVPSVTVGKVSADFGQNDIVVPIMVENNPGFSGFSFCVKYDTKRLVFKSADMLMDGYDVVGYPEGYGVNIGWTGISSYSENGKIIELHFSLTDNAKTGKAYIDILFREGYDSFYYYSDNSEQDIVFNAYSGYVNVNNQLIGKDDTQIDFENSLIFTEVQLSGDVDEFFSVTKGVTTDVQASHSFNNVEFYGTGSVITVYDDGIHSGKFTLIVEGDVNGDSVCDTLDAAQVALVVNGQKSLADAYAIAADVNSDDITDIHDYQIILNKVVL